MKLSVSIEDITFPNAATEYNHRQESWNKFPAFFKHYYADIRLSWEAVKKEKIFNFLDSTIDSAKLCDII